MKPAAAGRAPFLGGRCHSAAPPYARNSSVARRGGRGHSGISARQRDLNVETGLRGSPRVMCARHAQ
eukprot:1190751-Lingulodinium_polyedra.AAC.1